MRPELLRHLHQILPPPVSVRHAEYSMLFSADDERSKPTPALIELALKSAAIAAEVSLDFLIPRIAHPPYYPLTWPGEHYKLLAGLLKILKPRTIVEIGTGEGLSALTYKHFLEPEASITTFDVLHWQNVPNTCLIPSDFDPQLQTFTEDLARPDILAKHRTLLENTDILFIDAAKDGVCEPALLASLHQITFKQSCIAVFDDIRLWNMLKVWREISKPKLDVTSFGHWSGTGFVEWGSLS